MFGCPRSLLLHVGFSLVVASGGYPLIVVCSLHCSGFSVGEHRALEHTDLSSCGMWAQQLQFQGSLRAHAQ